MNPSQISRLLFPALVLAASSAGAQVAARKIEIPVSHQPPAGLCRIWVSGVPATKQPAPTDCATALRNKPANGTVVFGASRPPAPVAGRPGNVLPETRMPPDSLLRVRATPPVDTSRRARDSVRARDSARVRRDTTIPQPPVAR